MKDGYSGRKWQQPILHLAFVVGKYILSCLPARVRGALYEYGLDEQTEMERLQRVLARMLPRLNIIEIVAEGNYGAVASLASDTAVLTEYMETGKFASEIVAEFSSFLAHGGTFLDIGANIGLTTIPIVRNELIKCLAFEPDPLNFNLLTRNIARNAHGPNVSAFQLALFDRHDTLQLAKAIGNIGDHRINIGVETSREIVEVKAVPLDDYFDQIVGPLAIKIDTQGAEPYIIAGGPRLLAKAELLAIEFCPFLMRHMGGSIDLVLNLISSFDSVAVMTGGVAERPNYIAPRRALDILEAKLRTAIPSDSDYLDILARRSLPKNGTSEQ